MDELIALVERYREGALTLEEFGEAAAAKFVYRGVPTYPETDGGPDIENDISNAVISSALRLKMITKEESRAIYDALPDSPKNSTT